MPTYDYACRACGHALELFHSMTEPARRKCPRCGKLQLERRIGAGAGFLFKGSGFYLTDYRSESYEKARKEEQGVAPNAADAGAKPAEAPKAAPPAAEPATGAKPAVSKPKKPPKG